MQRKEHRWRVQGRGCTPSLPGSFPEAFCSSHLPLLSLAERPRVHSGETGLTVSCSQPSSSIPSAAQRALLSLLSL